MLKKIGIFFEEHIEKIILIILVLLCVLLFFWRVLLSPNTVEIKNNDGKTEAISPGAIDERVWQIALSLSQTKASTVEDFNSYEPKVNDFVAVLESPIRDIDPRLTIPNPEIAAPKKVAGGKYNVPDSIGQVTAVEAEHIRAAVYLPTEPITEQKSYDQVGHEPNDIDFVTVEGKFDIAGLFNQFHITFMDQVEEQYADPCLARPIFASVNLQRRALMNDGTWGDWQNVPRSRIEQYKNLFDNIQEGMNLPPGGLEVQLLQFDNKLVQIDLLQPQVYQIASAREEWFPPSLHGDYKIAISKEISRERREERESERQDRTRDTTDRRGTRATGGRLGGNTYDGGMGADTGGRGARGRAGGGRRGGTTARGGDTTYTDGMNTGRGGSRRRGDAANMEMDRLMMDGLTAEQTSPINDIYREFYKIKLNWGTDLSKMREPLVFWAFDDTVEPEKSYQYKIRLGIFNPVAEGEKDDVVIWSEFSPPTDIINIPARLYFYAKDIQEAAKTVTITVCKYVLGYWRVEDFRGIGSGEAIGGIKEYEPEEPEEQPFIAGGDGRPGMPGMPMIQQPVQEAEIINFDTRAVLIDVVATNDWIASDDRNLSIKPYYEMLYNYAGTDIEHMPIRLDNLPEHLKMEIYRVNRLSTDKPEPFKAFGSSRTSQRGMGTDGMRGGEYDNMMYQEMMMMDGRR
jgi:hypothetical protein